MGINLAHCPICGAKFDPLLCDFVGDETLVCPNGHSIVYHFPETGESSFDCPKCGKTHIVYDNFDRYPVYYNLDFTWFINSMYKIFKW